MAVLTVLLLAATLSVCEASTVPGVKIRFSRRGLDFGGYRSTAQLQREALAASPTKHSPSSRDYHEC